MATNKDILVRLVSWVPKSFKKKVQDTAEKKGVTESAIIRMLEDKI